jgi:DNA-binding IclR family transcriptional regulator
MISTRRTKKNDKYTVPALARAFEMLDILAMSSVGMTKMEIARRIGIPYSTAFNLLNTMDQHGYVRKDEETGRYYLGLKILSLGGVPLRDVSLRDTAAPVLAGLVRQTGLTAHLAVLDRDEAVYIDKHEPNGFLKINSWIGKRNYVHSSAVGKALIAWRSDDEVREVCGKGLCKRTAKTITSLRRLKAELAAVRPRGYAIDDEEDEVGGRCVAAPVFDAYGAVAGAIGLSGIVAQLPDQELPHFGLLVSRAAAAISQRMGHTALRRKAL